MRMRVLRVWTGGRAIVRWNSCWVFLHNPKFRLRSVLKCIEQHIEPMREKLLWGYDYPYMVTGLLNQHPRSGMAFNASKDRGQIVKFYDQMEEQE